MALRRRAPQQGNTVSAAAVIVLAALTASPALAAPDHEILCDDEHEATLDVAASELTATPANTSAELLRDHLLKPRVDATAREVFDDDDEGDETDAQADNGSETEAAVRSVSESKTVPLKRQMYRRDI